MSINIGPPAIEELKPRIVVVGVGGAGGNAIANMIAAEIDRLQRAAIQQMREDAKTSAP